MHMQVYTVDGTSAIFELPQKTVWPGSHSCSRDRDGAILLQTNLKPRWALQPGSPDNPLMSSPGLPWRSPFYPFSEALTTPSPQGQSLVFRMGCV